MATIIWIYLGIGVVHVILAGILYAIDCDDSWRPTSKEEWIGFIVGIITLIAGWPYQWISGVYQLIHDRLRKDT